MTRPESGNSIGCLVVTSDDMVKVKAVEFLLELSYLLVVGCHAGSQQFDSPKT
jgi:hypothetical protein